MRTRKLLVVGDVHLADLDGGGGVFDEKNAVFCLRSRLVFFQLTILIQLKGRIRCDRVSIRRYCLAQRV